MEKPTDPIHQNIVVMLSISDQTETGRILALMSRYSLNRPALYQAILSELTRFFGMTGACSVIRFSNTMKIIGKPWHINTGNFSMHTLWLRYAKLGNNPYLYALKKHPTFKKDSVGFITGNDLLNSVGYHKQDSLKNKLLDKLRAKSLLTESGLWLKPSPECIWAFCLRRKKSEGPFTQEQKHFLEQLGRIILGARSSWYIPAFDILDMSCKPLKDKLTERQYETLYHLGCYSSRKECARLMGVTSNTIDRNIETLLEVFREYFAEFQGKGIFQIINGLKNRARIETWPNY